MASYDVICCLMISYHMISSTQENNNELCKKIDAACALLESDSKIPSKLIEDLYFSIDKELINFKNL